MDAYFWEVNNLSLCVLIGLWAIQPCLLPAQPETGHPLPRVVLAGEDGGLRGGGDWQAPLATGRPVLLACIHPDREYLIDPLNTALVGKGPSADSYQRFLVYDTRASWKPDRVIVFGHWFKRLGQTIDAARRDGIVQALLVSPEPDRPDWIHVYDRVALLRSTWKLPDGDLHLFVLDPQGRLRYFHAGPLNEARAQEVATLLRKLG